MRGQNWQIGTKVKYRDRSFTAWQVPLLIILLLFGCFGCGSQPPPIAQIIEPVGSKPVEPANSKPEFPQISGSRLMEHVEALAYERYRNLDRDRARDYIIQSLEEAGYSPQLQSFDGGINIVAVRPGTDAAAGTILLGAHYDTVPNSPGADDNATGVAAVLEIARLLANVDTPRTLELVFFDSEEVGLLGSLAYASTADAETLHGAIVLDMLGVACRTPGCQQYPQGLPAVALPDTGDFLAVVGNAEDPQLLTAFQTARNSQLPPVVTLPIPLRGLLTPDVLRSDHAPFWLQGIGAVMVTDTANFRNPHYHQPTDLPETLDRDFFQGSVQLVLNATTILLEQEEVGGN
ncbi:MAG: M20/M25/M40 family metallo-hydrolase [Cyanobacteriota bacterium]|nr:M20/M25/M40 family metallo-hydrolase [Cyanobacteriota bacterium]